MRPFGPSRPRGTDTVNSSFASSSEIRVYTNLAQNRPTQHQGIFEAVKGLGRSAYRALRQCLTGARPVILNDARPADLPTEITIVTEPSGQTLPNTEAQAHSEILEHNSINTLSPREIKRWQAHIRHKGQLAKALAQLKPHAKPFKTHAVDDHDDDQTIQISNKQGASREAPGLILSTTTDNPMPKSSHTVPQDAPGQYATGVAPQLRKQNPTAQADPSGRPPISDIRDLPKGIKPKIIEV